MAKLMPMQTRSASAEWQILVAVDLLAVSRVEALGHECVGIVPELAVAMHGPRHHQHLRALADIEILVTVVLDRLAVDRRRWRVEPQRFLEGGTRERHHIQPFDWIGLARQHVVDLRLDALALPRRLGEQVDGPAQRPCRGLVAGADEGNDVVGDFAGGQPVRTFGAEQQRQEILRRVRRDRWRCGLCAWPSFRQRCRGRTPWSCGRAIA